MIAPNTEGPIYCTWQGIHDAQGCHRVPMVNSDCCPGVFYKVMLHDILIMAAD